MTSQPFTCRNYKLPVDFNVSAVTLRHTLEVGLQNSVHDAVWAEAAQRSEKWGLEGGQGEGVGGVAPPSGVRGLGPEKNFGNCATEYSILHSREVGLYAGF